MKDSRFEVENKQIKTELNRIAHELGDRIPDGWGFTLLIFQTKLEGENDGTRGALFYISSAEREGMIKAMKEFIAHVEIGPVDLSRKPS